MQPIPNSAGAIVYLVDQLNKYRSLNDFEERILCRAQSTSRFGCKGSPRQSWTAAEDTALLDMKRHGRTSNAIGTKLGRSAYSVRCRLRRLNMERRHG